MTKLKNTKKGMAKKALSVSLVAAMLATSNVPVWAAEDLFTDGSAAVEAPVVEEPAAEVFSSEAEAPVVEDAAPADDTLQADDDSSISNPKTTLAISESGWANNVKVNGEVYDKDGHVINDYYYAWVVDGKIDTGNSGMTGWGSAGIEEYHPSANDIGKTVELHIYDEWNSTVIGNDAFVAKTNAVTISKANVDLNSIDKQMVVEVNGNDIQHQLTYTGKTQYYYQIERGGVSVYAEFENATLSSYGDFDITTTVKEGNGVDAGSVYTVTATPKDSSLYTGTLNYDYKITEKDATLEDLTVSIVNSFEYTGKVIVPEAEDFKVVDTRSEKTLNSAQVIDTVQNNNPDAVSYPGDGSVKVTLHNVPNYTESSIRDLEYKYLSNLVFKVTPRDLSECTIKVDTIAYTGTALKDNDRRFEGKIHFFDKTTGEELNLRMGVDYDVHVAGMPTDGTKDYTVEIKAKANTVNFQNLSFTLGNETFETQGYTLKGEALAEATKDMAYTGEDIVKDTSKIVLTDRKGTKLSPENYEVTVYGKDAGPRAGQVVITGLKSYAGCEEVYYFDIEAAEVVSVDAADKVVYNKGYTNAAQYAPSVTVIAKSYDPVTGKEVKTFTLTAGDYTTSYQFQTTNMIGEYIYSKVQVTNDNFKGGETVFSYDTIEDETHLMTLIAKRDLSTCTATAEPGSYVYTGAVVKPTLKVMDGNEPLTEGVDYEIVSYKNAKDVGTATVVIRGIGENDNPSDGIYDEDTTLSINYEITPANAEDIKVEFAGGNTGIVYTGSVIKPTIYKVTLNGNDVSKQFDFEYPSTNINVGKGHVILKPVSGNKNFTGTKDAEFDIVAAELQGELKVYDEKGIQYNVVTKRSGSYLVDMDGNYVSFAYDGEEHTFSRAEFVPDRNGVSKYATEDDYEIVYIDNVYGKVNAAEYFGEDRDGHAYIAVIGKGNFTGSQAVEDASGDVFHTVDGAAYKFGIEKYEILKQHVTVSDGEYAAGQPVRPDVQVVVGGKTLVENQDYKLLYTAISDLTNGKTMKVEIAGINGYKGSVTDMWGVVKRDMANTQVVLGTGTRPSVTVYNSGVVVPSSEYTVTYETDYVVITANEDSKYYTGSTQAEYVDEKPDSKPATPVITNVKVNGNKVVVEMAGESEGASGYDFVISDSNNYTDNRLTNGINKNCLTTSTTYTYVPQGMHYAYVHAWKRGEDGQKVFSEWSNIYPFVVSAITPEQPVITSTKLSGRNLTVTWTQSANATTGYDVVMGTAVRKVNGELRPVEYGKAVKKVGPNTFSVTFKSIPKGTYYVGLHAHNRTSDTGVKVFSPWSNSKKVVVK